MSGPLSEAAKAEIIAAAAARLRAFGKAVEDEITGHLSMDAEAKAAQCPRVPEACPAKVGRAPGARESNRARLSYRLTGAPSDQGGDNPSNSSRNVSVQKTQPQLLALRPGRRSKARTLAQYIF